MPVMTVATAVTVATSVTVAERVVIIFISMTTFTCERVHTYLFIAR